MPTSTTNAEAFIRTLVTHAEHDERLGPDDPVGFVYFREPNWEDQAVRVGYVSSVATEPDNESAHPMQRFAPYVFPANWGEPTLFHLIAAYDYLVLHKVGQFAAVDAEYSEAFPVVRWMNGGSDFILADRMMMIVAANRERTKARRTAKIASMR